MPYFAVYAPDYTDDEAIQRRLSVREAHLANAAKNPAMSPSCNLTPTRVRNLWSDV